MATRSWKASRRRQRPACWGKLAVLGDLLARYEWVLWADSDALVLDLSLRADHLCDNRFDLVAQSMDAVHAAAGITPEAARSRALVNTGVFLLRSSPRSLDLLRRADAKAHLVAPPAPGPWSVWDGLGDQEALAEALREHPGDQVRIATVDGLQCHPRMYRPGLDLFVHFYGNHAAHRIPRAEARDRPIPMGGCRRARRAPSRRPRHVPLGLHPERGS